MLNTLGALVVLFTLVGSVFAFTSAMAVLLYRWSRRTLYTRPLTREEQWAETTQQTPEALVELESNNRDLDENDNAVVA